MTINNILEEIKKDKKWILKVINSCETEAQLKSCYNIIKSWSKKMRIMVDGYSCPFYKYNEIKKIQTIYKFFESRLYSTVDKKIVEN